MFADLSECDRIAEKARDGRGQQSIWGIPIGDLLATLDKTGQTKDTIVILASDHGEMMGSHGLPPKMKQLPYDESARGRNAIR